MRSFIIGCSIVAVALGILAYVAIYPYVGRVRLPALPVGTVVRTPPPQPCGPGLATQDLAGQCRSKLRPTMGALEALGKPTGGSMKAGASTGKGKQ